MNEKHIKLGIECIKKNNLMDETAHTLVAVSVRN